jgi:hypothetical protein
MSLNFSFYTYIALTTFVFLCKIYFRILFQKLNSLSLLSLTVHNFARTPFCFCFFGRYKLELWSLAVLKRHNLGTKFLVGQDSSVGIATRYGLDGPGIEFRWGRDFTHPSRPALGPTQPPIQWVSGLSGGKVTGAWRWPPTPI